MVDHQKAPQSLWQRLRRLAPESVLDPESDNLRARIAELEAALAVSERKGLEYFQLIDSVLAQRDTWKHMFNDHSGKHLAAQALLEVRLDETRQVLHNAILMLNRYRAEKNEPPVVRPDGIDCGSPPVGTAEAFAKKMAELRASAPVDIDGVAERDRITTGR